MRHARPALPGRLLYLSAYVEGRRADYYGALSESRRTGDLKPWIRLFLDAIAVQSVDAARRADELTKLEADYRSRIESSRSRVSHLLVDLLFSNIYVTAAMVAKRLKVTPLSARASISDLERRGILAEITGRRSGRIYAAKEIVEILDRATARGAGR